MSPVTSASISRVWFVSLVPFLSPTWAKVWFWQMVPTFLAAELSEPLSDTRGLEASFDSATLKNPVSLYWSLFSEIEMLPAAFSGRTDR